MVQLLLDSTQANVQEKISSMEMPGNTSNNNGQQEKLSEVQLLKLAAQIANDQDEDNKSMTISIFDKNVEESNSRRCWSLCRSCAACICVIFIVFGILALIIERASKSDGPGESKFPTSREAGQGGNVEVCGSDSFMLRDGVCDEITNNELCHWDGGDCCQDQFKMDNSLCRECKCQWTIDKEELRYQFEMLQVAMLKDPGSNFNPMYTEKTVVNVVSKDVCDMICTLSEISQVVNAWAFDYGSGTCTCTWLTSLTCDLESVESADENSGLTVAYIQYAKTLPCSCQALHHKLLLEESNRFTDKIVSLSSWHCQKECIISQHCTAFSWDQTSQECTLVAAEKDSSQIVPSPNWVSGVANCSTVEDYLNAPTDRLLIVGGYNHSYLKSVELFDLSDPSWTCPSSHYFRLPIAMHGPTGNTLLTEDGSAVAVVCGGVNVHVEEVHEIYCYRLGEHVPIADIPKARHGATSITINDGQTLWVTGGSDSLTLTYYVSLTTTSLPGPDMPFQARQHCMIKADKNTILVVGGRDDSAFVYFDTTWMFNVKSMAWTQTAATLDKGRRDFACGRVFDSNTDTIYIVVTGGEVSNGVLTSTTEMIKIEKDLERELSEEDFSTWEPGPDFPFQAYMMAGTSTSDQKRLIVAGGHYGKNTFLSDIFQLQCWNQDCKWTLLDHSLKHPRRGAVAIILPNTEIDCEL